jgi:hypothetical protein
MNIVVIDVSYAWGVQEFETSINISPQGMSRVGKGVYKALFLHGWFENGVGHA